MNPQYNHKKEEERIYNIWEKAGLFNPDNQKNTKGTFSIVLPPPNVTGTLHLGHAAMLAVEDILVRYNRMLGKKTVWIPGTDSAAIATQSKVEGIIYKNEGKRRNDIGRDELIRRIETFTKDSEGTIINQVKRMGSSLDWSRYAYTLDDARYNAVMEAFKQMYEEGLIYRGNRIVNWDPEYQTTVADDEIEYVEKTDPFYFFKYGPFIIGTVRPETKFGDKYIVVNPRDKKYRKYKNGQKFDLEWINGPITATLIKDEAADPEEGTGAMTITPAHSFVDFEIAKRHGLEIEQIIDEKGLLLPIAGEFSGMHIKKARPLIVEKLKNKGLLQKVNTEYVHKVAINYRGGGIIEPQIKLQWWVDVNKPIKRRGGKTLKDLMRDSVREKQIKILPERFEKVYYHWIDNLQDWCISRQIWFGHRIPVWYLSGKTSGDSKEKIKVQTKSPGPGWKQDPDTLDTWFSSGLWTFSTLGWPNKTKDLEAFHPTSLLETGYDILFFWVARMILMSKFLLGDVPFRHVYLHGLVRDEKGRKMSKSLGNIIDPLDMIEKYGADAVRLSLIIGAAPGNDIKISEDRIRGYRNFSNKIWNIARFLTLNCEGKENALINSDAKEIKEGVTGQIEWCKKRSLELQDMVSKVTKHIESYRLNDAASTLYDFIWNKLASEYVESSKDWLKTDDTYAKYIRGTLVHLFNTSITLLHPFMPFITEVVWEKTKSLDTKSSKDRLMIQKWPDNIH